MDIRYHLIAHLPFIPWLIKEDLIEWMFTEFIDDLEFVHEVNAFLEIELTPLSTVSSLRRKYAEYIKERWDS